MTLEPGSGWAASLFEWTWRTSLAASLLFLAILAVKLLLRERLSARVQYALSVLVFLRLVLPITPESAVSLDNLWRKRPAPERLSLQPPRLLPLEEDRFLPAEPFDKPSSMPTAETKNISWQQVAFWIWFAGLAGLLGVTVVRHSLFVSRIRSMSGIDDVSVLKCLAECCERMQVRRKVALRQSGHFQTPILFGLINPCIVLPLWAVQKMDIQQLRSIFLHELAHIRRWDVALNWCIITVRAWHWFNPLVWLAQRRLIEDRELLCDAIALSRMDADVRAAYGHTLIEVATKKPIPRVLPTASAILFQNNHIKRRIQMIARFHTRHPFSATAAILLGLVLTMSLSTRGVTKKDQPGKETLEQDAIIHPEKASGAVGAGGSGSGVSKPTPLQELEKLLAEKKQELETARNTVALFDEQEENYSSPTSAAIQDSLRDLTIRRRAAEEAYPSAVSQLENVMDVQREENGAEAISSLLNDPNLSDLLGALYRVDQEIARKKGEMGSENPELKKDMATRAKVMEQINGRIRGIVRSLEVIAKDHKTKVRDLEAQILEAKRYLSRRADASKALDKASRDYEIMAQKIGELHRLEDQKKKNSKTSGTKNSATK